MEPNEQIRSDRPGAGQRSYVALLFSDLCDYSGLNEISDPEDAEEVRRELEELWLGVIRKHGGAVSQVYGDGVLAVFGLPVPHENDARRAIEAALELHELVKSKQWQAKLPHGFEVRLHSGVHAGLVFARVGDALHGTYDLTGDPVVTTSRLCAAASRHELLVSANAFSGNEGFFSAELVTELALKGKRLPITAHRITGRSEATTRFESSARRGFTRFVGRSGELTRLIRMLDDGGFVAVSGDPGIGKSRLLEEFRTAVAARGMRSLRGTCESYGENSPLQPFIQVLRQLFGIGTLRVAEAAAKVAVWVDDFATQLRPQLPILLRLLSLQPWPEDSDAFDLQAIQTLYDVIDALARHERFCVVLDDWQWADVTSREVLRRLVLESSHTKLRIVVALRGGESEDALFERGQALSLRPLSEFDAACMMRAVLPRGLDLGAERAIHQLAGGNPLFIEELCRSLPHDSFGQALAPDSSVPSTLHEIIQARVARLPPSTVQVLEVASVMGPEFSAEWLIYALGATVRDAIDQALSGDVLVAAEQPNSLRFKHGIIREVIYESIRISERRSIHRRLAEIIELSVSSGRCADQAEALAHHYLGCGDAERAATYAELAGHKAAAASALDRARRYYETALAQLDRLPPSAELKERWLQDCMKWAIFSVYIPSWNHLDILERALAHAIELANDGARAAAEHWLGWLHHVLGDQRGALDHFQRAKQLSTTNDQPKLIAQVWAGLGQSYVAAGRYPEALECLTRGLDLKRSASAGRRARNVAQGFSYALGCKALMHADQGEFEQAQRDLDEALESVRGTGHAIEASVLGLRHMTLIWRGDFAGCLATTNLNRQIAERLHAPYVFAMTNGFEGYALFMLQRSSDALRQMHDAIAWLESRKIGLFISFIYSCFADALERSGDAVGARDMAQRALARAAQDDVMGEPMAYRALARLDASDPKLVDTYLANAMSAAQRRRSRRELAVTTLLRAELELRAGSADAARSDAHAAECEFVEMGMPWYAQQARAVTAGG